MLPWPIAENLARVNERITRACERAGRSPDEITLVAVSKTFPAEAIRAAYECGIRHFGENRVQEWEEKCGQLSDLRDATWHLVGHLQSNKARKAAQLFHRIDSVDSLELAQRLDRAVADTIGAFNTEGTEAQRAQRQKLVHDESKRLSVLIEVRLAPEETKSGISPEELPALVEGFMQLPQLELRGLMCIPPLFDHSDDARPYFRKLRELRETLMTTVFPNLAARSSHLSTLSMGMSHDFEIAIEEGATEIRIGTALFGARGTA